MYRVLRPLPLLFLVAAATAHAQGIHLRWGQCVADGGVRNISFACNTNTGSRTIMSSFVLAAPLAGARSVSGVIDVIAADLVLPEWWNYRFCRSGSISVNSFAAGPIACTNFMGACFSDGDFTAIQPGVPSANAERLEFTQLNCAPSTADDLLAGVEYLGPVLTINFNRTVGSPSCTGCGTGVCLILTQLQVGVSGGGLTLTNPAILPDGNVITWQGVGLSPGGVCQGATPTRRTLWGEVKALYR